MSSDGVDGGGGGGGSYHSTTITGNPWRIDYILCEPGGQTWFVFENGQRVSQEMFKAIRSGQAKQ